MAPAKRQRRQIRYQYRLLWKYTGSRRVHELRADRQAPILKMLRRVATKTPWLGVGKAVLRSAWARLCFRLNVPFDAVSGLAPKDVIQRIQDTFPRLDWVRVEHRQVGDWVETIDPLNTLRTAATDAMDQRTVRIFDTIEQMPLEELDKFRTVLSDDYLAQRKRNSNNRENVTAPVKTFQAADTLPGSY